MLLKGTDGFHERSLEIITDTHDLPGRLHLRGQRSLGADELIERKSRQLDDHIVQHRLEAGISLLCDGVLDLIQCVSKSDLRRHLGNGVACRLGSQSGRTAHTRIDFNDTVFKCLRVQGVLHVTSACDVQLTDDIQRGGTKHLVLLVSQCLRRSHNNAVSGMHTHRINIFHVTNRDAVALAVTHHLVFDLFPSRDTALYEHLSYTGETQTVF